MDVLPALPDVEAQPNGILLTDRELVRWQPSNPVDFADWFYAQMAREYREAREVLAKQMDVEDVPAWYVKTTLQRTVQALKRHRDLYFADAPEDRPASIIITTLAARAYPGAGSLYEVLRRGDGEDAGARRAAATASGGSRTRCSRARTSPTAGARSPAATSASSSGCTRRTSTSQSIGEERGIDRRPDEGREELRRGAGARSRRRTSASELRDARDAGELGMAAGTGMLGAAWRRAARCGRTPSMAMRRAALALAQQAFALRAPLPRRSWQRSSAGLPRLDGVAAADGAAAAATSRDHLRRAEASRGCGSSNELATRPRDGRCRTSTSDGTLCLHEDDEWTAGDVDRRHDRALDGGVAHVLRDLARNRRMARRGRVAAAACRDDGTAEGEAKEPPA